MTASAEPPPGPEGGEPPDAAESPSADLAPQVEDEPGAPPPRGRRLVREYLETLLVAILVVLFTTTFAVQNSVIPTASMEDTLLIGDYLLVNKVIFSAVDAEHPWQAFGQRPLQHGDVIVFKFPKDPEVDYIKRVIGLPGDRIEIRNKQLLRNGEPIDEPYKTHKTGIVLPDDGSPRGARDNFSVHLVPPDSFFVMGDNRDYSADSREWLFVPRANVTGRAFLVFWSHERRPGTWALRGTARARQVWDSIRNFHRDTRWERLGTLVK